MIIFFHAAPGVSKCYPNPCLFDGECVEKDGSYFCKCKKHFTGTHCQSRRNCLIYAPKLLPLKKRYLLSPLVSTITFQNRYALSPLVSTITSQKSPPTNTSWLLFLVSRSPISIITSSYALLPLVSAITSQNSYPSITFRTPLVYSVIPPALVTMLI